MPDPKLGKKPAAPDSRDLMLAHYLDLAALPPIPPVFGHQAAVPVWGMLGNDQWGDCVWAGAAHETMLLNTLAKRLVRFTNASVLADYSACTGFNPNDPSTDQGTDMRAAAKYRKKVGVADGLGHRHKIGAFVALAPGDLVHLDAAMYLFDGAVGIGIQFPGSAMDQFNAGEPWDVVPGATIEGGHYIPGVAKLPNGNYGCVTWGKVQEVTPRFLHAYMDEGFAYLSSEARTHGVTPEGFHRAQLLADLAAL